MLEALTRAVLRHRHGVIAAWLVVVLAGAFAGAWLPSRLTALTAVPDSQSAQVNAVLAGHFHENDDGAFTIVLDFANATPAQVTALEARLAAAVAEVPTARVLLQRALGGTLFAFVGTDYSLLDAASRTDQLRGALLRHGVLGALVSGPPALEHDVRPLLSRDLLQGTTVAVVLALLLLLVALGWTRALIVPFTVAAATVTSALCVILVIVQRFTMVLYIPNVIELIGLGLAIDYSLLVVHRFRSEIEAAGDTEDAVLRTMATAGRTVALSGLTAALGLSVLFFMPVPFVRSLGAAGMVVPALAVLVTLTLQPALLAVLGRDGVRSRGLVGVLASASVPRAWQAAARLIRRRPGRLFTAGLLLLALLAAPAAWLRLAPAAITAGPAQADSMRAVAYLTAHAGPGIITPHQVVVDLGHPGAAGAAGMDTARLDFASALSRMPEVLAAVTDTTTLFRDPVGRYQRFIVVGRHSFDDPRTQELVATMRGLDASRYGYGSAARVLVGGAPAQGVDFLHRVFSAFPWILLVSMLLAYAVMTRAFRSRRMPLVAVLMNLASVAAALGVVALVFRFGWGAGVLGAQRTGRLESWSLVFLFAMLFGLSMDYQVFLMARIREAQVAGASLSDAVAEGVTSTGVVISVAAVILVGALSGLVFGHIAGLQQLGVGLAVGVLIDATIVRGLVLPSLLTMLDHRGL